MRIQPTVPQHPWPPATCAALAVSLLCATAAAAPPGDAAAPGPPLAPASPPAPAPPALAPRGIPPSPPALARLEPLGWDAKDRRIYWLEERGDEWGGLPTVMTCGVEPWDRECRRVRAFYTPDEARTLETFPAALQALRVRLAPLVAQPLEGVDLQVQAGDWRVCAQQSVAHPKPTLEAAARALAERSGQRRLEAPGAAGAEAAPVFGCQLLRAALTWQGYAGETAVETWGELRIVGAWTLPADAAARVVALEHRVPGPGTGTRQTVLSIVRALPADRSLPEAHAGPGSPAATRHAACAAGLRFSGPASADAVPPPGARAGRWLPELSPAALGLPPSQALSPQELPELGSGAALLQVQRAEDESLFVVTLPAAERGHCVVGSWSWAFGGLGGTATVVQRVALPRLKGLLLLLQTEGTSRGWRDDDGTDHPPSTERGWVLLRADAAGLREVPLPALGVRKLRVQRTARPKHLELLGGGKGAVVGRVQLKD